MEENFGLTWEDSTTVVQTEEVICGIENEILPAETEEFTGVEDSNVVDEEVIDHHVEDVVGQGDASVLYLSDGNMVVVHDHDQGQHYNSHHQDLSSSSDQLVECQVASEEIITDQWVQECAEEIVVGSEEAVGVQESGVDEYEIPLPTCQDEYTAARPYPCDFCSRRFRKKANLMNHMVAHQTDRPHGCNLCGVRYIRKCDLMNHLKIHAYIPDADGMEDEEGHQTLDEFEEDKTKKKRQTKKRKKTPKVKEEYDSYEGDDTGASSSRNYNYVDDENIKLLSEMPHHGDDDVDNEDAKAEDEYSSYLNQEQQQQVVEERYPITDPRKPFVCQHCGVGFAREKAFLSHSRLHDTDDADSPFECQKCGEMFWDHNQMRAHAKEKHGGTGDIMDEDFEEDVDDDDEDADYSDEETKYGTFYCSTCGLSFHRQDNLRRHQRVHVKEEYVNEHEFGHVCNVCGESFQEALDLLAHAEVHARSVEHRCMICGESFQDENSLAVHVQAKHGKTLPANTCMLCGRTCKDRKTLLKHSWEHSKEKLFACSKCAKTFHNKARLKRHMLSHRNKVVQCDVCNEEFPDGRSLMNHRHSHSSVSGRQFPCRECGKTFGSRSSQQIHIRIHTGERPYGCRFCWKAFADGGTLRKHERIHTGEKPYACAVCPRAFNQRVVLREHIRSHHSGPDPKYCNSLTPYCCTVCSDMFATSQDLILHLIHHCDMNTAMKRQPQIGPRKYKRRRKLKPHELELISSRNEDDIIDQMENPLSNTLSESEEDRGERKRKYTKRQSKKASTTSPKEQPAMEMEDPFMMESYNNSTVTAAVESITSTNTNYQLTKMSPSSKSGGNKMKRSKNNDQQSSSSSGMPSRPKMIHTQKTRVPIEAGEDGRVRHKTKTLITRTQPTEIKSVTGERIRPRTKNVSYHILQAEKLPLATFPQLMLDNQQVDVAQQAVNALLKEEEHQHHQQNNAVTNDELIIGDHLPSTATTHYNGCSYEETPPEVASEQIIECEADEEDLMMEEDLTATTTATGAAFVEMEQQKPTTRRRRTSTTRTRSTSIGSGGSKAMKNVIIGPGSKVRLIKEGMIVSKARTTSSSSSRKSEELMVEEQPECIIPDYIEPEHMVIKEEIVVNHHHHHHHQTSSFPATVKQEILDPSPLHELAEISMQHANASNTQNLYKCEMCSEVFSDRAQLLVHVPIHI